ncbi:unnamed protein product [Caenorhabditis angaria]|uniref:Anaphase-promoting complex subunit 4 WD40 domain-containing protein n=1 Tax=Caenorhabditis angaria TaxID=860376 RepID=A0A9P1N373_9PELO|nr:unnamed protein product [Caenorhabditis angaria]
MSMKIQYRRSADEIGNGTPIVKWRPNSHALAVACPNQSVIYYDKKGNIIDAVEMTGPVLDIAWDKEGDVLAIAQTSMSTITLWDVNSRSTDIVESGAASTKEVPTCMTWSPVSSTLVVGNNGGNLLVYNHRNSRKVSLMGKHQRSVAYVRITNDDLIVSCSDDNTISISSLDGQTIATSTVSGEPTFLEIGQVVRSGTTTQTMISCILGKKILMLADVTSLDNPVNLQFQERYGNITSYSWYNDGYLSIGFDKGYIVSISAHQSELGSEISSITEYKTYLGAVITSQSFDKVLSVGDNQIKIRELSQMNDMYIMSDVDTDNNLNDIQITDDGQLIAVTSISGQLFVYVTKMPSLAAAYCNTIAYLTGLTQITISADLDKKQITTLEIGIEPSLLGVGPMNFAVATNNQVFFYDFNFPTSPSLIIQQSSERVTFAEPINKSEYLATVTNVQLNSNFAAITTGNKLRLHKIRYSEENNVTIDFPEPSRNARLLSSALTDNFLIFSTDTNYIVYFSLDEWSIVSEYRHVVPLRSIFPHPTNVMCCCFDDRLDTLIYSAVDDGILKLPAVGSTVHYKGALWETFTIDKDTFAVYDNQNIYVFLMTKRRIEGEGVAFIGTTKLPYSHVPLTLNKGLVKCLVPSGKISSVLLNSHRTDTILENKNNQQLY